MKFRETKEKIFSSRAFYIIFSIVASLSLWLYVEYVDNPDVSISVSGIQVEFKNQDAVAEKKLIVTDISARTLSLKFQGKRSVITKLNKSDVTATVDLADVSGTGIYQLSYTVVYPSSVSSVAVSITGRSDDYIAVTSKNLVKKDITVRGTFDGTVQDGFEAEPIEFDPQTITVSGPDDQVNAVSYAWVTVLKDNIAKTISNDLHFILMDTDGRQVTSTYITPSQDTVRVTIPVVTVKDVPLVVNLTPAAGANSDNTTCAVTPSSIKLSGDPDVLAGISQVILGTVDLGKFALTDSETFKITAPDNTVDLSGAGNATVNLTVNGLSTAQLSTDNIKAANVTKGYSASVVTKSLEVTIRGTKDEVNLVTPSDIRVVADLSSLGKTSGTFTVPASVYLSDTYENTGAVGDYKVTVTVKKD